MRKSGSESWRLSIDEGSQSVHAVLFFRDAFHLTPDESPEIPPRLSGEIPDLRPLLSDLDLKLAASEWTEWWGRLMLFESTKAHFDYATLKDVPHVIARERLKVFDPPYFESLAQQPSMLSIAGSSYREAFDWQRHDGVPSDRQREPARGFIAAVAEEVRDAFEVRGSQVNAEVLVLRTIGSRWNHSWPGLLVCSQGTFHDDAVFAGLLREVFVRNLGRDT